MKKLYFLFVLTFAANVVWAQLYEGFNYTAGQNVGGTCNPSPCVNNNWTTHSATNTGTIDVLSGSLNYAGLQASSGNRIKIPGNNATTTRDINTPTLIIGTPAIAYYSLLLNVVDNSQLATLYNSGNFFLCFGSTAGNNAGIQFGRVGAKSVNAGANFRLGVHNGAGGGTPTYSEQAIDLNFGTTYLVVVKYEITAVGNDIATIWVNPASLGETEPAGGASNSSVGGTTVSTFGSVCITNTNATPNAEIDEVRTGTTWASVTPAPPTVTSFTPISGYTGTSVVITGTNFTGATTVSFGGTNAASFTVDNATQITAIVGAGSSGVVSVTTPIGTASFAGSFTYNGYITNAAGNWSAGTTWLGGNVPPANSNITLAHAVVFDVNATVNNFSFSSGQITLGSNTLTVAGTITGGSASNYAITNGTGTLTINNVGGTTVTFPVGPSASLYHPVTINNSGTPDNFSVKVSSAFPLCVSAVKSVNATWDIAEAVAGASNCAITLNYTGATVGGSYITSTADIVHCNGTAVDYHNGSVTGMVASGSGFTSFSPFGITDDAVVLPVTLVKFAASKCGSGVCLQWTTANEENVSYFEIERSTDGVNYSSIASTAAANTPGSHDYSVYDASPAKGINYYQLRMVDIDDKYKLSQIAKVDFRENITITISPNPASGEVIIQSDKKITGITLIDMNGRIVKQFAPSANNRYNISTIRAGIYFVRVSVDEFTESVRLLVQ